MAMADMTTEHILRVDCFGRVTTTRERREALLAEFDRSGISGQRFAKWAGIKYPTWASWVQKRRKEAGKTPSSKTRPKKNKVHWLEAVVTKNTPAQESATSKTVGIIVQGPGGVRIEVCDAKQVGLAVQLLRELKRGC
jgi:transposase